jgi:hypothetical protein
MGFLKLWGKHILPQVVSTGFIFALVALALAFCLIPPCSFPILPFCYGNAYPVPIDFGSMLSRLSFPAEFAMNLRGHIGLRFLSNSEIAETLVGLNVFCTVKWTSAFGVGREFC